MKTCGRCGRNLDLTGHSLTCPVGQVSKQIDEGRGDENVRVVFPNDESKAQFGEMMMRTAQMMSTTKTFFNAVAELNDEAHDLTAQVEPHLEKFITDLILIYPNPNQFDADLKTLLGQIEE